MFIITYTAEHNHPAPTHRNSLAGSTRQKFPAATAITTTSSVAGGGGGGGDEGEGGSPVAGLSPTTPLTDSLEEELLHDEIENEEEEEGMLLVDDMEIVREDEFLILGQEGENTGGVQLRRIEDDFSDLLDEPCFNSPWMGEDTGGVQSKRIGDDFSNIPDVPCFNSPWMASGGNNTAAMAGARAS